MIPSWLLRLCEEGAVGVAIMTSDTRGLWHADVIRSAAARPRGPKSATGVLGLVLTRWRLASTDAGRNEALGLHELERRRLQAGTLSGYVEYLCLATAAGVECRVVLASRVTSHSNDLNANKSKKSKNGQQPQPGFEKNSPVKVKNQQVGVLPVITVYLPLPINARRSRCLVRGPCDTSKQTEGQVQTPPKTQGYKP